MKAEHLRKSENTYFTVESQTIFSFGRHAHENKKRRQKLGHVSNNDDNNINFIGTRTLIKFYKNKF